MVNISDFNLLATRTANCLLGVDCSLIKDTPAQTKDAMEKAIQKMVEDDKQELMNKNSKGPYFLIFILFLLLLGFSLDKEETE